MRPFHIVSGLQLNFQVDNILRNCVDSVVYTYIDAFDNDFHLINLIKFEDCIKGDIAQSA